MNNYPVPLQTLGVLDASAFECLNVASTVAEKSDFQVYAISNHFSRSMRNRLEPFGVQPRIVDFANASVEDLIGALAGIDAVFLSLKILISETDTNCQKSNFSNSTLKIATDILTACQRSRVRYVILTSNPSPLRELSLRAPVLETRVQIEMAARRILSIPYTILSLPLAYETFLDQMLPRKTGPDLFEIDFPIGDGFVYALSLEDIGEVVVSLLKEPHNHSNTTINLTGEHLTIELVLKSFNQVFSPKSFKANHEILDRKSDHLQIKLNEYWFNSLECYRIADSSRDIENTHVLAPSMRNFKDWIIDNSRTLEKRMSNN